MSRLLTLFSSTQVPTLGTASFAAMDTTVSNDLSNDGQSWSQSGATGPLLVTNSDKLVLMSQRNNGGNKQNVWMYSNDGGATWNDDDTSEGFLERAGYAYDADNDLIHALYTALSGNDGIIYRQWSITRDGSGNITGLARVGGINLQLDYDTGVGSMYYQHPIMLHVNDGGADGTYGKLIAIWSARNAGAGKNEIRASMCVLGNTQNQGATAGNWAAPFRASGTDTDTLSNAPQVNYSIILSNSGGSFPSIAHPSAIRKPSGANASDLYIFYHDGGATATQLWAYKRGQWSSANNDWRTGLTAATTISVVQRGGSDTGYTLKGQLGSKPVFDATNDRIYFGLATWKSNALGDTWGYVYIDSAGTVSSLVDVYSAGGAHVYAPCGDIAFDPTAGRLVVSYIKQTTQHAYARLYDGTTAAGVETTLFTTDTVDIPLLYPRYSNKVLIVLREATGAAPYTGYFGSIPWQLGG